MTPPVVQKLHEQKLETLETDFHDLRFIVRSELESVRGEIADSNTQIRNLKNHELREAQSDLTALKLDISELKGAARVAVWFLGLVALINVVFLGVALLR